MSLTLPNQRAYLETWRRFVSSAGFVELTILPSCWLAAGKAASSRRRGPSRKQPACFIGRDANGQALAYVVYFEDEPGRRSAAGPQDGLGSAHSYPFALFGELHR